MQSSSPVASDIDICLDVHARRMVLWARMHGNGWTVQQTLAYAYACPDDGLREVWFHTNAERLLCDASSDTEPIAPPRICQLEARVRVLYDEEFDCIELPDDVKSRWMLRNVADARSALCALLRNTSTAASWYGLPPMPAPHVCVDCCSSLRDAALSARPLSPASPSSGAGGGDAKDRMLILQRSARILHRMRSLQDWMNHRGFVCRTVPDGFSSMAEATTHTSLAGGNYCIPYEFAHEFILRMVYGLSRLERYYFVEKRGAGNNARTFKMHIDLDMVQPDTQPADQLYVLRAVRVIQMTIARFYADSVCKSEDQLRAYVLTAPPKVQKNALSGGSAQRVTKVQKGGALELDDFQALKRSRSDDAAGAPESLIMSYGTHVYFPSLVVTQTQALQIREASIHNLQRLCGARTSPMNAWVDVFDLSIYTENGLRMYGSDKWERKCSACAGGTGGRNQSCHTCHGRNGHGSGRLYTPKFVLNGACNDWSQEEARLSAWHARLVEIVLEDGFPPFAVAAHEAEQLAMQRTEGSVLPCTLCLTGPQSPTVAQTLPELMLTIMQEMYTIMNWSEMHRILTNNYYAAMMLSIVVAPECPETPGFNALAWDVRKSALTQQIENDARRRMAKQVHRGAATERKEEDPHACRERARRLVQEASLAIDQEDYQRALLVIERATAESHNTRRFATMQTIFNMGLPETNAIYSRYRKHVVRNVYHMKRVHVNTLLSSEATMYRHLRDRTILENVYLVFLQGPHAHYCHNIHKDHSGNNIAFLFVDGFFTQVCFSDKLRPEGACCLRDGASRRRFRFSSEPLQLLGLDQRSRELLFPEEKKPRDSQGELTEANRQQPINTLGAANAEERRRFAEEMSRGGACVSLTPFGARTGSMLARPAFYSGASFKRVIR